jgi:NAD(P)-dependent dehydrogenase (short-subunit alcohol dehydrogenase family)
MPARCRLHVCTQASGTQIFLQALGPSVFRTVPVAETTEATWDERLDLNLRGAFFCVKAVLPESQRKGGGKVINITSIATVGAFPNCLLRLQRRARDLDHGVGGRARQAEHQTQLAWARQCRDATKCAPARARK